MRINEVKDGVILDVNVKPNSKVFTLTHLYLSENF